VFPRQAAEQDRDAVALGRRERALDRTLEVDARRILTPRFEAPALVLDALPNLLFDLRPRLQPE
jgi:hypothetical protein